MHGNIYTVQQQTWIHGRFVLKDLYINSIMSFVNILTILVQSIRSLFGLVLYCGVLWSWSYLIFFHSKIDIKMTH